LLHHTRIAPFFSKRRYQKVRIIGVLLGKYASVAQLDRALASEAKGRGFKSRRAYFLPLLCVMGVSRILIAYMEILFEGAADFRSRVFDKNKALFHKLSNDQNPHTLFIGCSDSRVVPDLITRTLPGELFVVRNIANVVPYYRLTSEYLSTTSAIEYAIKVLNVGNVIICGHSNCGGCKALSLSEDEMADIPHTRNWLKLALNAQTKAEKIFRDGKTDKPMTELVEQINIVEQMGHLVTWPFVKERLDAGTLNIYGWFFEISCGTIYNYDFESRTFKIIE